MPRGQKVPSSLQNIYKELMTDVQGSKPLHGHLGYWVHQGVLLLNTSLTVQVRLLALALGDSLNAQVQRAGSHPAAFHLQAPLELPRHHSAGDWTCLRYISVSSWPFSDAWCCVHAGAQSRLALKEGVGNIYRRGHLAHQPQHFRCCLHTLGQARPGTFILLSTAVLKRGSSLRLTVAHRVAVFKGPELP